MIHGILTLATCALLYLFGLSWPAMLWSAAYYFGREMSQAEYRYIEAHGKKRANCPWYCGLCTSAWTWKAVFDCFLPWLVGVIFAIVAYLWPLWK